MAAVVAVAKRTFFVDLFSGEQLRGYLSSFTIIWSLGPIVAPVDAAVARTLDERLAGVGAALPPLIAAPADPAARRMLAAALVALADTLAGVNPALGLE